MAKTCLCLLLVVAANAEADVPEIYVTWGESPAPVESVHYAIITTGTGSPDYPDIKLLSSSQTRRIWSTNDDDNPDKIGDIGIISCPASQNFGVTLREPYGGPGARHVKGINLVPTSSSNYSNVVDGVMTGNLEGDLAVQRSSGGSGGEVTLSILGDISAGTDVDVPRLKQLIVGDDVLGTIDIDVMLRSPTFSPNPPALEIGGDVSSGASITVDEMQETDSGFGVARLLIEGSLDGSLMIGLMGAHSTISIDGDTAGSLEVTGNVEAGQIYLNGDIESGATLTFNNIIGYSHIFLGDNAEDTVAGRLILNDGIPSA